MADRSDSVEHARLHAATLAEHRKPAELQVIGAAEEVVACARILGLLESQVTAMRRHSAAKGRLTKALQGGGDAEFYALGAAS